MVVTRALSPIGLKKTLVVNLVDDLFGVLNTEVFFSPAGKKKSFADCAKHVALDRRIKSRILIFIGLGLMLGSNDLITKSIVEKRKI